MQLTILLKYEDESTAWII